MAQHDYDIANATGATVRTDLNNVFSAIRTNNSNSGDLTVSFPFQWHVDTSFGGGTGELKMRNSANNAYISLGSVATLNQLVRTGSVNTFSVRQVFGSTDSITLPVGNTSQRDGSPAVGMLRYNNELNTFEGYKNIGWGEIGGGAGMQGTGTDEVFLEGDQNVTGSYQISANKNAMAISPIINSGQTVTVPAGAVLVIL